MMIKVGNSSVSYFWSNTRSFDRGTLGCKYLENGVLIRFNNSGMNAPAQSRVISILPVNMSELAPCPLIRGIKT